MRVRDSMIVLEQGSAMEKVPDQVRLSLILHMPLWAIVNKRKLMK